MTLFMLEAYYSCGCDSRELFRGLAIENSPDYETHLNKHNVITLDVQELYLAAARARRLSDFSTYISERVNADLCRQSILHMEPNLYSFSTNGMLFIGRKSLMTP